MTQHLVIGSENNILDLAKQIDFTPEYFYFEADISKVIDLGERYQIASIANYLPDSSMSADECADEEKQSLQELTNFVQQIMITHKEIKLYLAWYGNEKHVISNKRSVDIQKLSYQDLIMHYDELLTVYRSN